MIEVKMYKEERKKELTLLQYRSNISHNKKNIWDKKREASSQISMKLLSCAGKNVTSIYLEKM